MDRKDLEALVGIAVRLGTPVPEIYWPGIVDNLERLLDQARLVMAAPLPEALEAPGEFEP